MISSRVAGSIGSAGRATGALGVALVAIALQAGGAGAGPAPAPPDSAADRRCAAGVRRLTHELAARNLFEGAVVILRHGREIAACGEGRPAPGAARTFTPDTPADGASLAKTFTGALVLELVAEGRLGLDDPVARHIPEYPDSGLRVRHLLVHSTGLPDYDAFEPWFAPDSVRTTLDLVRALRDHEVAREFVPGTRFEYRSLGYDLAALVSERVAGASWFAQLRTRWLGPLGMDSTFLRPARFADWPGPRTIGSEMRDGRRVVRDVADGEGFYGGSNLYFSARDIARWASAFATGRPLSARARTLALGPAALGDGRRTGLTLGSWYAAGDGARYYYTGHLEAFDSFCYWDADRGLAIAWISSGTMPAWLPPRMSRALIALAEGRDATTPSAPGESAPGPGESFAPVHGTYEVPGVGRVMLAPDGRATRLTIGKGPGYRVVRVGHGVLFAPGLDAWIGFSEPSPAGFRRLHWTTVFHVATGSRAR